MEEIKDYKEAYLAEKKKVTALRCEIAERESAEQRLKEQIKEMKESPSWKLSKPIRGVSFVWRKTFKRLKNLGGPRGALIKIRQKLADRKRRGDYGTKSFPNEETRRQQSAEKFPEGTKISILVPLYNTPRRFLEEMIASVTDQTCGAWELCLADGSDAEHAYVGEYCQKLAAEDGRILYRRLDKNEGISGNTNKCLEMATGNYIGLFDHDDVLHPSVIYEYMCAIRDKGADYLYCDEATFKGNSIDNFITLHFKPDFAPDNLRANNYICHFSVFKRDLLDGTELFRPKFDGSQDHDMILRLTDRAQNIVHIPKLMYYWRSHAQSTAADISAKPYAVEAARGAISDHLTRHGFYGFEITSSRAFEAIFRIRYVLEGEPKVSILIPNHEHEKDLRRCISSILEKSTYTNYEIIVIENGSKGDDIKKYYAEIEKDQRIRVVNCDLGDGGFNFSKVINYGAKYATGEYLLLLNNDTEVIALNWLEELIMFAARADVGAVGAKLYYPDNTIQHAGIVLGLGAHRTAGHVFYKFDRGSVGYMGKLWYEQNMSAVTGACLMVSKDKFEEVGGLDEQFTIALNDVDFCLRLRDKGYVNIWNPYCELYHYESVSRGSDVDGKDASRQERYNKECELFKGRWKELLDRGDPYYNVNLTLDRSDCSLRPAR